MWTKTARYPKSPIYEGMQFVFAGLPRSITDYDAIEIPDDELRTITILDISVDGRVIFKVEGAVHDAGTISYTEVLKLIDDNIWLREDSLT